VFYWVEQTPDFGVQAVALDETEHEDEESIDTWIELLVSNDVKIVAPPLWQLVQPDDSAPTRIAASYYAKSAKEAGLDVITWTLERTPPGLDGWYWQTLQSIEGGLVEGDRLNLLYVLAFEVEVLGVFSDWPATTTFFANCFQLGLRSSSSPQIPDLPNDNPGTPKLAKHNIRKCSPESPCNKCEGDCNSDDDCEGVSAITVIYVYTVVKMFDQ
jgi:hypothetical protein